MGRTAMGLRVVTVKPGDRTAYAEGIAALERGTSYPLGDDRFELDHGEDYFAFFDRLGETVYEVALDGKRVVGVSARILRRRPVRCWYLCDLKVHPAYRGRRIAARFARHAFLGAYARCGRGYGISMNEPGSGENRVARLVERLRMVPFHASTLELFRLDASAMAELRPIVQRHRGTTSFLSLRGRKDLVLERTGAPLPLLHVQFGPCAEAGRDEVAPGHTHMLCAPAGDALALDLAAHGAQSSATATVLHHRMPEHGASGRFGFVLTSDI
ncbi:MAG: GNAT family N-acetyltransferase [Planctomycetota bacterium]